MYIFAQEEIHTHLNANNLSTAVSIVIACLIFYRKTFVNFLNISVVMTIEGYKLRHVHTYLSTQAINLWKD